MAFLAQKNLGFTADDKAASKALLGSLKSDDSPLSHGYAFLAAAEMSGDVSKFVDSVEDVIAQADEVDDRYLQFEGGLFVTALVVDGAYKLAEKTKKAPTISQVTYWKHLSTSVYSSFDCCYISFDYDLN